MIEDDDKFRQKENLDRERPSLVRPVIISLVFVLWSAGLLFFFYPKMKDAVEKSGVIPMIAALREKEQSSPQRGVNAVYISQEGPKTFVLTTDKRGSDALHDTVEALISDYPEQALSEGCISLVDRKTELIGLTLKKGICYVNLSDDVLKSQEWNGYTAFDQRKDTLMLNESVKKVVILVNGKLTYSHGQAHGNPAMVTTDASRRMSYTVSGPRDPSGLALWFRRPSPVPFGS